MSWGTHVNTVASGASTAAVTLTSGEVIAALAKEGVGVYTSATATTPVDPVVAPAVPIRVLSSQAALYAAETRNHSGVSGSAINAMLPMPAAPTGKVYPGFDYLLAAYATAHGTPGEILAGRLLGTQNWTHPANIVFPDLILTLFSADAARAAAKTTGAAPASEAGSSPAGATLCVTLANWVSSGFSAIFNALTVGPASTPVLSFLTGIWNGAVALAKSAISNVASGLTDSVLGVIRTGVATAGVVAWAVSALRNLQITSVATPAFNSFGVDPAAAKSGTLTITVGNARGFDWPAAVSQCAETLGVSLPSLTSVVGGTVKWSLEQANGVPTSSWCLPGQSCELATEDPSGTSTSLRSDHTADFAYKTNTELADQDSRGKLVVDDFVLDQATVSLDTAKLQSMVNGIVLGAVPGAIRVVAGPMFDALTKSVTSQIASLAQPKFFRFIKIEHHQIPAALPVRSCAGLYTTGDFPGTTEESTSSIGGGTECLFTDNSVKNPPVAQAGLFVEGSNAAADAFYNGELAAAKANLMATFSPVADVGDEAVAGTACVTEQSTSCGPFGVVRIANDVVVVSMVNVPGSAETLLPEAIPELCPDCRFPTSPPA